MNISFCFLYLKEAPNYPILSPVMVEIAMNLPKYISTPDITKLIYRIKPLDKNRYPQNPSLFIELKSNLAFHRKLIKR